MREGAAQACLVVAALALGDRQVRSRGVALAFVRDGQPLDGARPSPWGNAQPSGDLPGDRGYLKLTSPTYDVQLAYSDQRRNVARFYACQRTP